MKLYLVEWLTHDGKPYNNRYFCWEVYKTKEAAEPFLRVYRKREGAHRFRIVEAEVQDG